MVVDIYAKEKADYAHEFRHGGQIARNTIKFQLYDGNKTKYSGYNRSCEYDAYKAQIAYDLMNGKAHVEFPGVFTEGPIPVTKEITLKNFRPADIDEMYKGHQRMYPPPNMTRNQWLGIEQFVVEDVLENVCK